MPPIILLSDSSANLFYGMIQHPFFTSIRKILDGIRATAHHQNHMTLFELDGATGNERLYNFFLTEHVYYGPCIEMIKCRNHQTNLVEGGLILAVSPQKRNLLSLFFGFTHFIRTGGHWMRLKQAVRDWVVTEALVHQVSLGTTVPILQDKPLWDQHAQELKSYLLSSHQLRCRLKKYHSNAKRDDTFDDDDDNAASKTGNKTVPKKIEKFFATRRKE